MRFSLGRGVVFEKNRVSKLRPEKRAPGGGLGRAFWSQKWGLNGKMRSERPIEK